VISSFHASKQTLLAARDYMDVIVKPASVARHFAKNFASNLFFAALIQPCRRPSPTNQESEGWSSATEMKHQKLKNKNVSGNKKEVQTQKVWINPNSSFKGLRSARAWDHRAQAPPTVARLLELADVALRPVQPLASSGRKKKAAA